MSIAKRLLLGHRNWVLLTIIVGLMALGQPDAIAQSPFKVPKPPNRGAPGTPSAGASRTGVELTALVPITPTAIGGYTTSEQPTFWFYNPYALAMGPGRYSQLAGLKLTLKNVKNQSIDHVVIPLPTQAGLLRVRLSNNVKLSPGLYRWSLQARVKQPDAAVDIFVVDGWLQRELPSATLTQALKTANATEQFRLYQQNGLWFDALTQLAELRSAQPQDPTLTKVWVDLLTSANLPQPVINCSLGTCQPARKSLF